MRPKTLDDTFYEHWYLLNNLTLVFPNVDGHIRISPLTKPQANLYHWLLSVSKSKIACYIPPLSWQMYKWCKWTPPCARCFHTPPMTWWQITHIIFAIGQLLFTFKGVTTQCGSSEQPLALHEEPHWSFLLVKLEIHLEDELDCF